MHHASTSISCEVAAPPLISTCWRCAGAGFRIVKVKAGTCKLDRVPCSLCDGAGTISRVVRKKKGASERHSLVDSTQLPGPAPAPPPDDPEMTPGPEEDLSYLSGAWRLFQGHATHRYSTDDVVTAWVAWRASAVLCPHPTQLRCLDIGCGIGSVLLMTAWLQPTAECVGVEAQASRVAQCRRSIKYNGVGSRVTAIHGDLRDPAVLRSAGSAPLYFDIITGTPPYFDVTAGSPALPPSEESARCLFEYRGGIEAYAAAAAAHLARPHGLFIVVESSLGLSRGYEAADRAGLRVVARVDAVPKAGKPPLFSVFVMCHAGGPYAGGEAAASAVPGASASAVSGASASAVPDASASAVLDASATIGGGGGGTGCGCGAAVPLTASLFSPAGPPPPHSVPGAGASPPPPRSVPPRLAAPARGVPLEGASTAAAGTRASTAAADADYVRAASGSSETGAEAVMVAAAAVVVAARGKRPRQAGSQRAARVHAFPGSLRGEAVAALTVRGADGARTAQYEGLLRDMGKLPPRPPPLPSPPPRRADADAGACAGHAAT